MCPKKVQNSCKAKSLHYTKVYTLSFFLGLCESQFTRWKLFCDDILVKGLDKFEYDVSSIHVTGLKINLRPIFTRHILLKLSSCVTFVSVFKSTKCNLQCLHKCFIHQRRLRVQLPV